LTTSLAMSSREGVEAAARLVVVLDRFWDAHGHAAEGREWCERVVRGGAGLPVRLRAKALNAAGYLNLLCGNRDHARPALTEALALFQEPEDRGGIVEALNCLANLAAEQGEFDEADRLWTESLAHARGVADGHSISRALLNLGVTALQRGDHDQATALLE